MPSLSISFATGATGICRPASFQRSVLAGDYAVFARVMSAFAVYGARMFPMKMQILTRLSLLVVMGAIAGGCGTFFPSKPAARAADRVLDEVFQEKSVPAAVSGDTDPKKP